ncbi:MAG: hypothetical protein D6759_10260 [Chloroflexi bacterium]|nr:MAG: hypothetical protein D6759_10260 [Chloroflexota bacterium]
MRTTRSAGHLAGILLLSLLLLGGITEVMHRAGPSQADGPPRQRVSEGERLAALVGRAEAWYLRRGYDLAPPPAAPSPFWPAAGPLTLSGTLGLTRSVYLPLVLGGGAPRYEMRGIWIHRYDWTRYGEPADPARIDAMVANVAGAGFNAIFFQVRAHGDAYYTPGLEPWAARLTGSNGATLGQDPGWDPLARMIEQAHQAGLEVHAYLNVYPAWLGETPPPRPVVPEHLFNWLTYDRGYGFDWRQWDRNGQPMLLNPSYLWASPGLDDLRDHVVAVAVDLVTRYPVDGLHLDLVRYPNTQYSYDPFSLAGYAPLSTTLSYDQWQRDRVTDLVRRIYSRTTTLRPDLRVSAAVWPVYQDRWGWGVSEGYGDFYQDAQGWLEAGLLDATVPMLYPVDTDDPGPAWTLEGFRTLLADHLAHSGGRHVYAGISGDYADFDEIVRRIEAARSLGAAGHLLFSYTALDSRGYWDDLAAGPYAQPAAVPPMPWRGP